MDESKNIDDSISESAQESQLDSESVHPHQHESENESDQMKDDDAEQENAMVMSCNQNALVRPWYANSGQALHKCLPKPIPPDLEPNAKRTS